MPDSPARVTRLLQAIDRGESNAADELLLLVYEELRQLAAAKMARERHGQTLQTTELVHEAYLRLLSPNRELAFENRRHFLAPPLRRFAESSSTACVESGPPGTAGGCGGSSSPTTPMNLPTGPTVTGSSWRLMRH